MWAKRRGRRGNILNLCIRELGGGWREGSKTAELKPVG